MGMKTAISLPDALFRAADQLAKRARKSNELAELFDGGIVLTRHAPDEVTEAMNRVVDQLGAGAIDPFIEAASRRTLEQSEW